jgi:hypothetical protein
MTETISTSVILNHRTVRAAAKALLDQAAGIIEDDEFDDAVGLLQVGAEVLCEVFEIRPEAADRVFAHAAYLIARAMGHYPSPHGDDPITRYALSILADHPWDEQARWLRAAAALTRRPTR